MMAEGVPQCILTSPSNSQLVDVDVDVAPIPDSPKPEFTVGGENEDVSVLSGGTSDSLVWVDVSVLTGFRFIPYYRERNA